MPTDCHYWQILVADDRFSTVDWVNRQSSLNDVQARIDPMAGFAAWCRKGSGVHNWLDKADWPWGILQARFYRGNDYPEAMAAKVPVAGARAPICRHPVLVRRARGAAAARTTRAQLRRIW